MYYSTWQNKAKIPKQTQQVVFIFPNDCCFQNQLFGLFLKDQDYFWRIKIINNCFLRQLDELSERRTLSYVPLNTSAYCPLCLVWQKHESKSTMLSTAVLILARAITEEWRMHPKMEEASNYFY